MKNACGDSVNFKKKSMIGYPKTYPFIKGLLREPVAIPLPLPEDMCELYDFMN